jgi:protein MpaA
MERLGQNQGKYHGERIDIHQVLREIEDFAARTGWERDPLVVSEQNVLPAFRRNAANPRQRVYISSGIHGDEPAGPLAVLKLIQQNQWPEHLGVWLIPCLNPAGFLSNSRENEDGVDLNRDYRSLKTALVRAHVAWLNRQPRFDVTLLLHEDWESNGFYLYELNPTLVLSLAKAIIDQVKTVCPIDTSPLIEDRAAENGIISANPDLMKRLDWPEAFYLIHNKSPVSYTLEAPSDFPMATRVDALVAGAGALGVGSVK